MTEQQWAASKSPKAILRACQPLITDRKLLLFCVHCCFFNNGERDIGAAKCAHADLWRLTERFADGLVEEGELRREWERQGSDDVDRTWPFRLQEWTATWTVRTGLSAGFSLTKAAHLLREIFGNPFRPVERDPFWLTTDVLALARGIYDERAFDRMPILADALQDAGCTNDDVLSHCRDAKQLHVRGCWVLDLLTGRG